MNITTEDILMDYCEPDTGLLSLGKHDHELFREALNTARKQGKREILDILEKIATLYGNK